jgi:hypothetical protein
MNTFLLKAGGLIGAALLGLLFAVGAGWRMCASYKQGQFDAWRSEIEATAATQIAQAEQRARSIEQGQVQKFAEVDSAYRKKLEQKDRERNAALAAVRSRGLYVNATCPDRSSALPGAAASASRGDGETRVRLSDEAAEFHVRLVDEADQIVEQLTACQNILRAERGQ